MKIVLKSFESTFISFKPIYDIDYLIMEIDNYHFIDSNFPQNYSKFLLKVKNYEDERGKKAGNTRYGYLFKILLPLEQLSNDKLIKITKNFINNLIGDQDLKYLSFTNIISNNVKYLNIYITDREFKEEFIEYYKRDYYVDLKGNFCTRKTKDKRLVAKKGDIKSYIKNGFVSCKTTLFTFSKEKFDTFIKTIKQLYFNILNKLSLIIESNLVFPHEKYNSNTNRYKKRLYQKINLLKIKIEGYINCFISTNSRNVDFYEVYKDGYEKNEVLINQKAFLMIGLFMKFKNRFSKHSYHDNGVLFKFNEKMKINLAEEVLNHLEILFFKEYNQILKGENL